MTSSHAVRGIAPGANEPQLSPDRSEVNTSELQAMHRYCTKYRDLGRGSRAVMTPYQLELPGLEVWLPESAAAQYLGLDTPTLRDLRSGHWKGITPYRECGGDYYYRRADLDGWIANNAQRKAGTNPANNQLTKEF